MKKTAIICEYNPFHRGHEKQIAQLRSESSEESLVICLMSGNFVQRGEPAIFDKYTRAKVAVLHGADIVLELPFPFSCAPAEIFARSAVRLLKRLNCVDTLCFGSESGDLEQLQRIAHVKQSDEFRAALDSEAQAKVRTPQSYIKAMESALNRLSASHQIPLCGGVPEGRGGLVGISAPNDILGVEYLCALAAEQSGITPLVLRREQDGLSASASRSVLHAQDEAELARLIPTAALEIFRQTPIASLTYAERAVLAHFRLTPPSVTAQAADMPHGLAERMQRAALQATSLDEFFALCQTKKYTNARLRRCILLAMLGIQMEQLHETPQYTQLLAASERGRAELRQIMRNSAVPILTKAAHYRKLPPSAQAQFECSLRADGLWTLCTPQAQEGSVFIKSAPYLEEENNA